MHKRDSRDLERRLEEVIRTLPADPVPQAQLLSMTNGRKDLTGLCREGLHHEYLLAQKSRKASGELRENRFRVENYLYRLALNEWVLRAPEFPNIEKSLDRVHHWTDKFESLTSEFADLRVSIEARLVAMLGSLATTIEDASQELQSVNPFTSPNAEASRSSRRHAVLSPLIAKEFKTLSRWAWKAGVVPSIVYTFMSGKTVRLSDKTKSELATALKVSDSLLD